MAASGSSSRSTDSAALPLAMGRLGPPGGFVPAVRMKVERARDGRGTVARLLPYLLRHRSALTASIATAVVGVGLDLVGPYLLGRAIDRHLVPRSLDGLGRLLLAMLAVYLTSAGLALVQSFIMSATAQGVVRQLRGALFRSIQSLPLRFLDGRPHGDLMSRATNDLDTLGQVLGTGVSQLIAGTLTMAAVGCVMASLNPILALCCITTSCVLVLGVNRWIARRIRQSFRLQQAALGRLNGVVEETVSGQRVVKAFNHEPASIRAFDETNQALLRDSRRAQVFGNLPGPMAFFSSDLGSVVVAFCGGLLAVRGMATVGTVAMFTVFTRQFSRPLNEIANLYNQVLSALAGAERVFEIIDEPPEVDAPPSPQPLPIRGEISFDHVSFSYAPGRPVLHDVTLHAAEGQTVALIGPTGSGKTTVVNLLARFYEVDGGRITVDGRPLHDIPRDDLRRQLGIVLQDTFLFAETVRDNIRYGRLDASDADVARAAKLANADGFISRLPDGYDTVVSERGGNLSQGQRQLIAIARAILADPRILILDEATSSVDTRTEQAIQEAMARLMAGRTCFVIAHRLSTIRHADQIVVVEGGRIARRGTPDELLAGMDTGDGPPARDAVTSEG